MYTVGGIPGGSNGNGHKPAAIKLNDDEVVRMLDEQGWTVESLVRRVTRVCKSGSVPGKYTTPLIQYYGLNSHPPMTLRKMHPRINVPVRYKATAIKLISQQLGIAPEHLKLGLNLARKRSLKHEAAVALSA